jgi:chromosome segregation ATPase
MNVAELKVKISGDATGALDSLGQVVSGLLSTDQEAKSLTDTLFRLKEQTELGSNATERQRVIYEAMQGRFGEVTNSVRELSSAFDALESRQRSDQAWRRYSVAVSEARERLAQMTGQTREDRLAQEIFGKTFASLTAQVKAYISGLEELQDKASRLDLSRKAAEIVDPLVAGASKGVEAEKPSAATYDALAGSMGKLRDAARELREQDLLLNAKDEEQRLAVRLLGVEYDKLDRTLQSYLKDTLVPLQAEHDKIAAQQRRQSEIGAELNRQLARQYAEISRAGADLGPLDLVLRDILKTTKDLTPENQKLLDQIRRTQPVVETFRTLAQGIHRVFSGVFQDLFQHGFKNFFSNVFGGFQRLLADMAQEWAKQQLLLLIQRSLGSLFSHMVPAPLGPSAPVPGRAAGGPVQAGSPYLVGEDGPELFVPTGSGTIVPNGDLGSPGTSVVVHNHFLIHSPNPEGFRRSVGQIAYETGRAIQIHLARNA